MGIIWRKPIGACKIQCQTLSRRLIDLWWSHRDIKLDCVTVHSATLSACMRIRICVVPCGMWSTYWRWSHLIYTNRCKWIRDAKFGRKYQVWNWKWNWRWSLINPKINMDLNSAKMHFWSQFGNPDYDPWWLIARTNSQAQSGVNFDFEVKFDLEGQCQSTPKTIGILTKVFYIYGPNLVILAWTGIELSCRQTWWRTDWRTDGQTQATTIPEGQNWPRVKMGPETVVRGMVVKWYM